VLKVSSSQNSSRLHSRTSAKKIMEKRNKNIMSKFEVCLQIYKIRNIFFKPAFDEPNISNDVKRLLGNLHVKSLLGSKFDGKQSEGYPCHSSTFKLSGKQLGPLENLPFPIISILRFFIFPKAFPFQCSVSSFLDMQISRHRISILLVPC